MKISKSTIIDAPASLVFQILMDIDLATEWIPSLLSFELISGRPNKVGSIYRSQLSHNGMKFEQISEIKALVENLSVEWSATTPFCESKVEYFLTPISDTQTEFKHVSECNYKGVSKFWAWLAKSKVRKQSEKMTDETHVNFKRLVEAKFQSEDK